MAILYNSAGLCDECRKWAEAIAGNSDFTRRKIGQFAERNGHKAAHYELHRLYMIKINVWHSLPALLALGDDLT